MFSISSLLSKKSYSEVHEEYVKVSSMIEGGSALDRRKLRNERRLMVDKRKVLGGFFSGIEKRLLKQRRIALTRREMDQKQNDTIENIEELVLNEGNVVLLVREQVTIIEKIGGLSLSAKKLELGEIKERIQHVSRDIRFQVKKEQHYLHLYLDRNIYDTNEEAGTSLSEINSETYNTSGRVLQLLGKYLLIDFTASSVGFFLLDMNIAREELETCLDRKKSYLYPKYLA